MDKISHIVANGARMSALEARGSTRPSVLRSEPARVGTAERAADLHAQLVDQRRSATDRFIDSFNDVLPVEFSATEGSSTADNRAPALIAEPSISETPPNTFFPRGSFVDVRA